MSAYQASVVGTRGFYFFLSYAHTPPILEQEESEPDLWVKTFYHDLSAQVEKLSRRGSPLRPGFMDQQLPRSRDWTEKVSEALGTAEVFVPLYSPMYLTRAWPLNELRSFRSRLSGLDPSRYRGHVQPVLWVPLAPGARSAELDQALSLDSSDSDYARNGLLAMCRLTVYREQYARVLATLAQRIVQAAESSPLPRPESPLTIELREAGSSAVSGGPAPFAIKVIAPTVHQLRVDQGPWVYDDSAVGWRPFENPQHVPAGEYVANVAQRLGLVTDVAALTPAGPDGAEGPVAPSPWLVLVDPWMLAVPGGRSALLAALDAVPPWGVVLVLVDQNDPRYVDRGESLYDEFGDMIDERQTSFLVRDVTDESTFVQLVPSLVTQAVKRFLRMYRLEPPDTPRPSMRAPSDPAPDSEEDR
jgi:FxsC-like protein